MCVVSYIQGVSYKDHFNIRHPVLAIDINIVDFYSPDCFCHSLFFFPKEKLLVVTKFIFLHSYIYSYKNNSISAKGLLSKKIQMKKKEIRQKV